MFIRIGVIQWVYNGFNWLSNGYAAPRYNQNNLKLLNATKKTSKGIQFHRKHSLPTPNQTLNLKQIKLPFPKPNVRKSLIYNQLLVVNTNSEHYLNVKSGAICP